jgi:ATP-binding cassette subfamily B multidrug efflux pump
MLRRFEALLDPTAGTPAPPPNAGLVAFYWFYIRQVTGLTISLFVFGGLIAVLDTMIPAFIGRVVSLVSTHTPQTLFRDEGSTLLWMAFVLLVLRPLSSVAHNVLVNQIVNPGFSNMIRWQNHWHVVRQSWTFFQNDFAGRIANRVLQTGPALRESLVAAFDAAWYILVYGSSALVLLGRLDWRLTLPMAIWFVLYAAMLRYFVPRLRDRSRHVSEMRSTLTGRVVDSYTNILTVKLFARAADEDAFVRDAIDDHTEAFRDQTRMATAYTSTLVLMNAVAVVGRAYRHWRGGDGDSAGVAVEQHRRVGGAQCHLDLREYRHGAGRHALDRRAAADAGPGGCGRTRGDRRRHSDRKAALRLRAGAGNHGDPISGGAARYRPDDRAGGTGRADRAVWRGQVDAG